MLLRFRNTARACSADRNRKATDIYLPGDAIDLAHEAKLTTNLDSEGITWNRK
jgi:hypothetical protein